MCTLPLVLKLFVVFVKDSMCAYCLKGQLLSHASQFIYYCGAPRWGERTACFAPSSPPFFFNMWMLTCDVCMSTYKVSPFCFRFTSALSKPFPRKKKRVQIACCILFWCMCVCQLSPQLVFYCWLLCVDPDETVCRSLLTTHYVYRRTLTSFFFCLFLCVHGRMEVT